MSCVETNQRANEHRENQKEIYTVAAKAERRKQKKQRREAKKAAKRNEYHQLARTIAQKLSQYPEIYHETDFSAEPAQGLHITRARHRNGIRGVFPRIFTWHRHVLQSLSNPKTQSSHASAKC
jgi:hypothetical protein